MFQFAKELDEGPVIIAINDDESIQRLKGQDRPVNNLSDRIEFLKSIKWIDYVVSFSEDTPYELFKTIKPAIIVKGGDYRAEEVVGHDLAKVIIFPHVTGFSTTALINLH
jgi:D-beta-D-heptose 7-phosphate kinase/D-beta-D-heptose 1-phosphate adenosyltransferase